MTIDQIFNKDEGTGGESYGVVPLSDRIQMTKNEVSGLIRRIVDRSNELTGKNIVEQRDLPSVMFDLEQFIWEETEKLTGE